MACTPLSNNWWKVPLIIPAPQEFNMRSLSMDFDHDCAGNICIYQIWYWFKVKLDRHLLLPYYSIVNEISLLGFQFEQNRRPTDNAQLAWISYLISQRTIFGDCCTSAWLASTQLACTVLIEKLYVLLPTSCWKPVSPIKQNHSACITKSHDMTLHSQVSIFSLQRTRGWII